LDLENLIFVSCHCKQAEVMLVADQLISKQTRFAAAFFVLGGIHNIRQPTDVDQLTFLPHLKTPSLLLNFGGCLFVPVHSQQQMLQLIPLEPPRKHLITIPKWQWEIPATHLEREVNNWLNDQTKVPTSLRVTRDPPRLRTTGGAGSLTSVP